MTVLIIKQGHPDHDGTVLITEGVFFTWWDKSPPMGKITGWVFGVAGQLSMMDKPRHKVLSRGLADIQDLW